MKCKHLRIDISKKSHGSILYIRDVLGLKLYKRSLHNDRAGTVIKLLLLKQIELYETDKDKFKNNWNKRKRDSDILTEIKEPKDISIRFHSNTIADIDMMKFELNYRDDRKKFIYELILEGINLFSNELDSILNREKLFTYESRGKLYIRLGRETIKYAHDFFGLLCQEFKGKNKAFAEKGKRIGVSKEEIFRWELMIEALDRTINKGYYIEETVV